MDLLQLKELGLDFEFDKDNIGKEYQKSMDKRDYKEAQKVTEAEVKHVAKLARLKLIDSEVNSYKKDLNSILEYVEMLDEIGTRNVQPMHHILYSKNVWREDEPDESKVSKVILSNAPMKHKEYFKVPKILEG